ncbi:hypothetical protein KZZ52_42020 [Dactylosporangium sp. AC04546]|uniref:hypothetical protein n=1 Tax=Dactylosporangium sp. AC04546 TaxID=2862460 RepID=UPI001EDCFA52|nr:hypothetical protein [Dactylosporangium sp. AC04546]WVK80503.1 hypothetical protein KZZ52_42020 [Dactylosporangium sp. AC04546]
MSAEYANKLEQWFSSAPGPVQEVLRPVFDPANEMLKAVAGDPQDLVRAGQRYVDISNQIIQISEKQKTDRQKLAGAWDGEGYQAFADKAAEIEEKLKVIGEATGKTDEVLKAAAEACVEGANLIIDIIVTLIAFAIGTLVVKLALAALTFGASMLAWVAEQIVAGIVALTRILNVTAQVARILMQVARIFKQIAQVLRGVANLLKAMKTLLEMLDKLNKASKGWAKAGAFSARAGAYAAVNATVLGGNVPLPGGSSLKIGEDAKAAKGHVDDAQDAAK